MAEDKAGSDPKGSWVVIIAISVAVLAAVWWFGEAAYLWVKAVHVMAVIAWMAGLLYLPRLFVYHADVPVGSPQSELFKTMERRLLKVIMGPSMHVAWLLGLWMAWQLGVLTSAWFLCKLALVVALTAVHGKCAVAVKRFDEDRNATTSREWRMWNEVPAVLMAGIVILVIVKPF